MPHSTSGGGSSEGPSYKSKDKKLTKALVVEDVKVIEKTIQVPVYKLVEKPREQIKYITKEKEQVKYNTVEEDTTKYNVKEEETVKYKVKEDTTVRYVPKEVEIERPVSVPKEYELPVIREKIVQLVSYKDVEAVKEFKEMLFNLKKDIEDMKDSLKELKEYKLVEEVVKVPKLEWVVTPVERIVWKDVKRERPK